MSPFTAFCAGMGTVVAALALGFSTAVMLTTGSSVSQKEPLPALQKRAETGPVELRFVVADPPKATSQLITAAQTPMISTAFAVPPPLWPPSARSTTGQSSREPALASDPGMRQIPARPAPPADAAALASAQPAASAGDVAPGADTVAGEVKKKKKVVQRKPRHQLVDPQGYAVAGTRASGYAPDRRTQSLGIFDLFLGDNSRAR